MNVLHNAAFGTVLCVVFLMTVGKAQRWGRAGQGGTGRDREKQGGGGRGKEGQGGAGWEVRCSSALTAREVTES